MSKNRITRREFLIGASAAVAGAAAACTVRPEETAQANGAVAAAISPGGREDRGPALRLAHLTDMHVLPRAEATDGFARALRHAQGLQPPVAAILNTGDCIMDSLGADRAQTQAQWDAFVSILEAERTLPIYHAIGNHDVWGWGLGQADLESDPLYGKGFALQSLGLSSRYYAFDLAPWRFLVLDSTHPSTLEAGAPHADLAYTGRLDDEQFGWLEQQLQSAPDDQLVCIVSHIPILCACELLDGPNEETGNWLMPGAWMHIDSRRMVDLFLEHPNVKACLSGHAHQVERLEYHGLTYLNDGAVCGAWWNGAYLGFPPAYVVVSLYADGTVENEFIAYDEV